MIGAAIGVTFSAQNALAQYLVYDNFQRPNNTTSLGIATTGQTWSNVAGDPWGIDSDQAYLSAATGGDVDVISTGSISNYTINATIDVTNTEAQYYDCRIVFRVQNGTNFYMFGISGGISLYKSVNGAFTSLASNTTTPTLGEHTITVQANGDTITCSVDGVEFFSVTDSTFPTGTLVGLRNGETTALPTCSLFTVRAS